MARQVPPFIGPNVITSTPRAIDIQRNMVPPFIGPNVITSTPRAIDIQGYMAPPSVRPNVINISSTTRAIDIQLNMVTPVLKRPVLVPPEDPKKPDEFKVPARPRPVQVPPKKPLKLDKDNMDAENSLLPRKEEMSQAASRTGARPKVKAPRVQAPTEKADPTIGQGKQAEFKNTFASSRARNSNLHPRPAPRKRIGATSGTVQTLKKTKPENVSTVPEAKGAVSSKMDRTWTPYECSCCFNDVPFEYMVQCYDGHLFCIECLQRYVHEAVYGGGMGAVTCLAENCKQRFPESQLQRALPDVLKARLEERIQLEEINIANLENFIRCAFCNCGAELDARDQYFTCPNEKCKKVSCKHCQVEYSEHKGLKCKEVEKEHETNVRKEYEEKMASAKIRECPKCKARFTKEEGCNKIVCRCGTIVCYVCRQTIKGYDHFCQHVRSPGKGCRACKLCKLFTNSTQDDKMAIKEIKKQAREARKKLGFDELKEIGAPI